MKQLYHLGEMMNAEHVTSPFIVTLAIHGQINGALLSDSSTICLILLLVLKLFIGDFFLDFFGLFLDFDDVFLAAVFFGFFFFIDFFFAGLLLNLLPEAEGSCFGLLFFFKPQTGRQDQRFKC